MPGTGALARNAAPITSTPSARRSRHDTASSTCVTRHEPHRARRGRRSPTPRTERCRACPHGLRPPPHGQTSSPAHRRRSTSSASLPTMTTGASTAPSNGPPVRPRNGEGRCAFQNVIRLSSHTKKGHPKAAPVTIIATSAAPPPPHRQAGCRSTPGPCGLLDAVQSNVQQRRTDHPTLRGSRHGGGELFPLDHTRGEPLPDLFPCGKQAHHGQKVLMIDAVERRRQIGIENPSTFGVHAPSPSGRSPRSRRGSHGRGGIRRTSARTVLPTRLPRVGRSCLQRAVSDRRDGDFILRSLPCGVLL